MFTLMKDWAALVQAKEYMGVALLAVSLAAGAQSIGEVESSHGAGMAQMPGKLPRTLGKGLPLQEGDRLMTADGATAIVKLRDGTRVTLRPNTEMVVQKFQFMEGGSDNGMLMQLVSGGLRALTGLISKASPNAAKIQTEGATLGIRGTDFDVRLCGSDCKAESAKVTEKPLRNAVLASAKLVSVRGDIKATDGSGTVRRLVDGGSVYPGDTVNTAVGAGAVLVFRDESRLTLGASTRFKVDSFVFDEKNPAEGRFLVSLLQGSMRALTGLIGTINKRNVTFSTPAATLGIRGTGFDLDCAAIDGTAADSCSFFTWLGSIEVTRTGQTQTQVLQVGQGLFVNRTGTRPLTAPTIDDLPRPDTVPVDIRQLFSSGGVTQDDEGLFVYVRDGHIEIATATEILQLGRGETGYAATDGRTGRPLEMPSFIRFDGVPLPNSPNPMLRNLLNEIGKGSKNQCP